jgi:hypothetical protein
MVREGLGRRSVGRFGGVFDLTFLIWLRKRLSSNTDSNTEACNSGTPQHQNSTSARWWRPP